MILSLHLPIVFLYDEIINLNRQDMESRGETTTISIYADTWERLNKRKGRGGSFDKVVNDLLDKVEQMEEERE